MPQIILVEQTSRKIGVLTLNAQRMSNDSKRLRRGTGQSRRLGTAPTNSLFTIRLRPNATRWLLFNQTCARKYTA